MKDLVVGGVKSGKSALGARVAQCSGREVVFIATATAGDEEMRERIERHRRERCPDWRVVEEPLHLARVLSSHDRPHRCLLVDCLTLWLTNLLGADDEDLLHRETDALLACLPALRADVVLIANETGFGVMPANALARRFCDQAGLLNQRLGRLCDRVSLVAAGLPVVLKGPPHASAPQVDGQ